jgi:hypothetical protein
MPGQFAVAASSNFLYFASTNSPPPMHCATLSNQYVYYSRRLFILFIFYLLNLLMAPGAAAQATPGSLLEKAVTFQPGFLPNKGQVRDAGGKPVDFVLYQANLGGQQVFVTNYGLSILLSRVRQVRHTRPSQPQ